MNTNVKTQSSLVKRRPGRIPRAPMIWRSQSGQSLVELALLAPILLLLIIGVVEMGRFAYISILVGNAAEAGAIYGAQSLPNSADTSGIQTAATNDFQNGQSLTGLKVTSSNVCDCDTNGTPGTPVSCTGAGAGSCASGRNWVVTVQVTASGTFNSLFNYPGIPKSIAVTRTVTMYVKQI
jgi:Flp pilus assembly protein TadG